MNLSDVRRFQIPEKPPHPYSHGLTPHQEDLTWVNLGDLVVYLNNSGHEDVAQHIKQLSGYCP